MGLEILFEKISTNEREIGVTKNGYYNMQICDEDEQYCDVFLPGIA